MNLNLFQKGNHERKVELEKEEAEAIERAKEYFAGTGKAFSQEQLEQFIGMADIDGINGQRT